ncbi:MAG: hypothetical protein ABIK48_03585 [candidate division WOR-3 bacterium]
MTRRWYSFIAGAFTLMSLSLAHNIRIDSHEVPLVIDTYARYRQNQSIFNWSPFDSTRQVWDLTIYPGQLRAKTGLRHYTEGRYPAPDTMSNDPPAPTVCEFDTLGDGSESESYFYTDNYGLYADGIDFSQGGFRFLGNYRPDGVVYNFPIYYGASWISAWSWQYEIIPGIPYQATEQHQKSVVARGKVKVPMSGDYFWPCLVIKDYMVYSDNMGTLDRRWIYEWVVPGHFAGGNGVAAAMSDNGAPPDFITVRTLMQVETCSIPGWDLRPPVFANTRVWTDTIYSGPFIVWSTITDNDVVGTESLFYRINQGSWNSVSPDSQRGSVYYFTIPQITPPARIDYYLWAMDEFSLSRQIDFWTTWPVCSPESTMITFYINPTGVDDFQCFPPALGFKIYPNPSVRGRFAISLDGFGAQNVRLEFYQPDGTPLKIFNLHPNGSGSWKANLDLNGAPAGVYFYRCSAGVFSATGKLTILHGEGRNGD